MGRSSCIRREAEDRDPKKCRHLQTDCDTEHNDIQQLPQLKREREVLNSPATWATHQDDKEERYFWKRGVEEDIEEEEPWS